MVSLFIGCDRTQNAQLLRSYKLLVATLDDAHPQWPGTLGGAQRYAAAISKISVIPVIPSAGSLATALYAELPQSPQALCLHVPDPNAKDDPRLEEVLAIAARAQLVIVTMGPQPIEDDRVYGHVGPSLPDAAEQLAAALARIAADRRSYLLLHSDGVTSIDSACYTRFLNKANKQPEVALLREGAVRAEPNDTAVLSDLLDLFPHAGLVVTLRSDLWRRATTQTWSQWRDRNANFRFITLSAEPTLWRALAAPTRAQALVGWIDGDVGFAAAEMAARAVVSERLKSPVRVIPTEIVTLDNLPDFAQRYSTAANNLDVSLFLPVSPAVEAP